VSNESGQITCQQQAVGVLATADNLRRIGCQPSPKRLLAVVSEGWCGRAHIAELVSVLLATPGYRTFKSVTPTAWVNPAALIFTNARNELRQRGGARESPGVAFASDGGGTPWLDKPSKKLCTWAR
jgi:hypothetical protein